MKKINQKIAGFGIVMAALVSCAGIQQAQAQTEQDVTVGLEMQSSATITTTQPATVVPTLPEILAETAIRTGAFTLTIDSSNGSTVTVEGVETGLLLNKDLVLTSSGSGSGVNALTVTGSPVLFYTQTARQTNDEVTVDLTINNLDEYEVQEDAYTNVLTFIVTATE